MAVHISRLLFGKEHVLPSTSSARPHAWTAGTFDGGWYRAIVRFAHHSAWLNGPLELYTTVGIALLAVMAIGAWWSARGQADRRSMAAVAWLGLGTLLSVGCGLMLKQVFHEVRPCRTLSVVTVEACPGVKDYSFPSDHMTVAVALAVGLWLVDRRLGLVAAALAAIEGFSRVYLGQHYPHDVLAAIVLSTVVMLAGWRVARRPLTGLVAALERTPLRRALTTRSGSS